MPLDNAAYADLLMNGRQLKANWVTEGAPLVVGAAVKSLYDTGTSLLGIDHEEMSTVDLMNKLNKFTGETQVSQEAADFYAANQSEIDNAGAIAAMSVPGTLGIKALKLGQAGLAVTRVGQAAGGLLTNGAEIAALSAARSGLLFGASPTGNIIKAAAAGGLQTGLEMAAFETAAYATMHGTSPIYEGMDWGDFAQHALLSAGAFGLGHGLLKYPFANYTRFDAGLTLGQAKRAYGEIRNNLARTSDTIAEGMAAAPGTKLYGAIKAARDGVTPASISELEGVSNTALASAGEDVLVRKGNYLERQVNQIIADSKFDPEAVTALRQLSMEDGKLADALLQATKLEKVGTQEVNQYFKVSTERQLLDNEYQLASQAITQRLQTASLEKVSSDARNLMARTGDEELQAIQKKLDALPADFPKQRWINTETGVSSETPTIRMRDLGYLVNKDGKVTIPGAKDFSPKFNPTDLTANPLETEAGWLATKATGKPTNNLLEQEAQYRETGQVLLENGVVLSRRDALQHLAQQKLELAQELYGKAHIGEIAQRLHVEPELLVTDSFKGVTADQVISSINAQNPVRWVKATYGEVPASSVWEQKGLANWDLTLKAAQDQSRVVGASVLGINDLPELVTKGLTQFDRTAAGLLKYSNAEYGSAQEAAQFIGTRAQQTWEKLRGSVASALVNTEQFFRSAGNKSEAVTRFNQVRDALFTGVEKQYVIDSKLGLVSAAYRDAKVAGKAMNPEGEILIAGDTANRAEQRILSYWAAHSAKDMELLKKTNLLRTQHGLAPFVKPENFVYVPGPALERNPFSMFVELNGSKGVILAKDQAELLQKQQAIIKAFGTDARMITPEGIVNWSGVDRVDFSKGSVKTFTQKDASAYFQAKQEYEYESAFTRTSTDNALKREGHLVDIVSSNDTQIFDDLNSWWDRKLRLHVADGISTYYAKEFGELTSLSSVLVGDGGGRLLRPGESSTLRSELEPGAYRGLMNTAMNLTEKANAPWVHKYIDPAIRAADGQLSRLWNALRPDSKNALNFEEAGAIAREYGRPAFANKELWDLAGLNSYTPVIATALRKTRDFLSATILGLDYINPILQAVSLPIRLLPEIRAAEGSQRFAIDGMMAASKHTHLDDLIAQGIVAESAYATRDLIEGGAAVFGSRTSQEILQKAGEMETKFGKFSRVMQKPTTYAESWTRNVAAETAIVIAESAKRLEYGSPEMWAFVDNFTKKVHGNYIAGQRPGIFQGVTGQAVSLFQSYQLGLMQQMFRFLEKGDKKTAAMMMGLQGTIFGAQSLPGFNWANQALLGNWNKSHADFYTGAEELLGEGPASFMLYGMGSHLLGSTAWSPALYSRGDVTPRTPTIVPIMPMDTAIVSTLAKYGKALGDFGSNIMNGGNFKVSTAQLLQESGVNRPLSGLSEVLLGAKLTNQGNVALIHNDMLSISSALKIMGSRPTVEAAYLDSYYRLNAYKSNDTEKLNDLGRALRTKMLAGDDSGIDQFAKAYSDIGANPRNFRKWYLRNLGATTSTSSQLLAKKMATSPAAIHYQKLAGQPGDDFSPAPEELTNPEPAP